VRSLMTRLPLLLLATLLFATTAQAELTIEITKGAAGALPIAIVPFGVAGEAPHDDLATIISADLQRSGRFNPMPSTDMLEKPSDAAQVNFQNWRVLSMDNLVIGKLRGNSNSGFDVDFQLFDVFQGKGLMGYTIHAGSAEMRRVAHHIADLIYEKLTGEKGAFNTRIAYITATRGPTPSYALMIADSDGYNPQTVLRSKQPIMSPSWSSDGSHLAYVSFEKRRSEVFVQDVLSGAREAVASYPGINGAPSWSPDGRYLALTLSRGGNPDVYVMSLSTKLMTRLTDNPAIDTEPTWAPDGDSVYFTSDRGGKPQIYRVSASGGGASRVTFDGDYNARPELSPDGKKLAMVHRTDKGFTIAVLDLQTHQLKVLSGGGQDESPSFAPNGSMILFAGSKGYRGVLSAVSVDGSVQQSLVATEGDVREPSWSPLLQ
jgi:TolB protein